LKNTINFLLVILSAFVLPLEIILTRISFPYFGNSFYSWLIVFTLVLCSYFLSYLVFSRIFIKFNFNKLLIVNLLSFSVLWLNIVLLFQNGIFIFVIANFSIYNAQIIFNAITSMPVLIPFALISQLLIFNYSANEKITLGKSSALVFFVNNIFTILVFYIIIILILLNYGLGFSILVTSLILALILASIYLIHKKIIIGFINLALMFIISFSAYKSTNNAKFEVTEKFNILDIKDGLFSDILVVENTEYLELFSNNVLQTRLSKDNNKIHNDYVITINKLIEDKNSNISCLLLGTGGGGLINNLSKLNIYPDIVEIDNNIILFGQKYFYDKNIVLNVYNDDARHYVKKCKKTYDLIVIDIFTGDNAPSHILTVEGLNEIKNILNLNGSLIIYFPQVGYQNSLLATNILLNTLQKCGYEIKSPKVNGAPNSENYLIVCNKFNENGLIDANKLARKETSFIYSQNYFTDDKPLIDKLLNYNDLIIKHRKAVRKTIWDY
jgi:predicted membrane-bound spermidine synthase